MADDSGSWGQIGSAIGGAFLGAPGAALGGYIGNSAWKSPGNEAGPNFVGPPSSASQAASLGEVTVNGTRSPDIDYTGLINSGISAAGGLIANKQTADSASAAQSFSADQYARRYQITVADLKAAGLSPMLAYSQGPGSSPSGVSYTAQNPFAGVSSSYSATRNLEPQRENIQAQTALTDAQEALAKDTASKVRAETSNVSTQGDVLKATIDQLKASADLMKAQGRSADEQIKVFQATVSNLKKDGTLKDLDIGAAKALGNFGREYKELGPIIQAIISILRPSRY